MKPRTSLPRDFGGLARLIAGRTSDLLAVAIVVTALLYLGPRVHEWWRSEPPIIGSHARSAPLAVWGSAENLTWTTSGGGWTMHRTRAAGSADAVIALCTGRIREILSTAPVDALSSPEPEETEWLATLAQWQPREETNGRKIYVLEGPWPWVVGTAATASPTDSADSSGSSAARAERVICWAIALPDGGAWTLYLVFRNADESQLPAGDSSPALQIPADARQAMTFGGSDGSLIWFSADASPAQCRSDWHKRLSAAGWDLSREWRHSRGLERAVYHREHKGRRERLDAALLYDGGRTTGICEWRPL